MEDQGYPLVLGNYHITGMVGGRGTLRTLEARDSTQNDPRKQKVVIKYAKVDGGAGAGTGELILENLALADLGASGVVVPLKGSQRWIACEYVNAPSLRREAITNGREFSTKEALEVCRAVAETLEALWEARLVLDSDEYVPPDDPELLAFFEEERGIDLKICHLALNPRNVFLMRDGSVKIKDFVINARHIPLVSDFSDAYAFQAPEVMDMRGGDNRSDIYSLGLLSFYLVTGEWNIKERLKKPYGLPEELINLTETWLAENPDERPQAWGEVIEAIDYHLKSEEIFESFMADEEEALWAGREEMSAADAPVEEVEQGEITEIEPKVVEVKPVVADTEEAEPQAAEVAEAEPEIIEEIIEIEVALEEIVTAGETEEEESASVEAEDLERETGEKTEEALVGSTPMMSEAAEKRELVKPQVKAKKKGVDKHKVGAVLGALLVVVAVLSFTAALKNVGKGTPAEAGPKLLPAFTGMSYEEAAASAAELGLVVEREDAYAEEARGTVVGQAPDADSEIVSDMVVRLTVGIGAKPEEIATVETTDESAVGEGSDATPVTAYDVGGGEPTETPVSAPAGSPPVAAFTPGYSSGPSSGHLVSFDASGSYDPDGGSIVSYSWSFGGGGVRASHEFVSATAPTDVAVTLTVIDEEGKKSSVTHYVHLI